MEFFIIFSSLGQAVGLGRQGVADGASPHAD
jgi:hypothetical protein